MAITNGDMNRMSPMTLRVSSVDQYILIIVLVSLVGSVIGSSGWSGGRRSSWLVGGINLDLLLQVVGYILPLLLHRHPWRARGCAWCMPSIELRYLHTPSIGA